MKIVSSLFENLSYSRSHIFRYKLSTPLFRNTTPTKVSCTDTIYTENNPRDTRRDNPPTEKINFKPKQSKPCMTIANSPRAISFRPIREKPSLVYFFAFTPKNTSPEKKTVCRFGQQVSRINLHDSRDMRPEIIPQEAPADFGKSVRALFGRNPKV